MTSSTWRARFVHTADLDDDGFLDVLSASFNDDKIAWYKNLGGGFFEPQQIISTEADGATKVYSADLDGDGDIDVLSSSQNDNKIAWYQNLGGGVFESQQIISTEADGATMVHTADLDGDGDIDVLSSSQNDNKIAWYENLGGAIFGNQSIISSELTGPSAVYTADLDGDGMIDVISASADDDKIAWYKNLGAGVFGPQEVISIQANSAQSVFAADLDNDGDLDVLSASWYDDKIAWYENLGGFFGAQVIINTEANGARSVFANDLDGDGDIDILSASDGDHKIAWYENLGGFFGGEEIISLDAIGVRSIHIADLDNDGSLDILSAHAGDDKIAWYKNQGGGFFGAQNILNVKADRAYCVFSADLDGDGDQDVLSASDKDHKIAWYENLGNGHFEVQQIINQTNPSTWVYTSDLDGDGDQDILSTSWNNVTWTENLGGGLFGAEVLISSEVDLAKSVHAADLDGDGDQDVLSASIDDDKIAWYENLGAGVFGTQQIISAQADGAYSVFSADLDGDGDNDVLSASWLDDKIAWYENLGGFFGAEEIISIQADAARSVYAADLDDDGDLDVLSASLNDNKVAWYENLDGEFGEEIIISTHIVDPILSADLSYPTSIYAADLDGDGDLDVLTASSADDNITWYENMDNGLFDSYELINTQAHGAKSVHAADLDGDGDYDVLSASGLSDKIAWYTNALNEGCTDPMACNYNPDFSIENGTCCYGICGCTDPFAENYNEQATCDDFSCTYSLSGLVYFDQDENGEYNGVDYGLPFQEVSIEPLGLIGTTNNLGEFFFEEIAIGNYSISVSENAIFPFYTTSNLLPLSINGIDTSNFEFGLSNELPLYEIDVNLYSDGVGYPCDQLNNHNIMFRNLGNLPIDGVVELEYDILFQSYSEVTPIDSVENNKIWMSFENLLPGEMFCYDVKLQTPTVDFFGEFLNSIARVWGFYAGDTVAYGEDSIEMEVTCAYDPNDKQVFPIGYSDLHYIHNDTTLEYLIRFQNTGNAPATDVRIIDTLDINFDISTFELVANSHSVFTTVDLNSRIVDFYFQDIQLPDSVNNEPESHGLVSFKIAPLNDLPLLTELNNSVGIYFDNNPPIFTNTTWSTIYDCSLFEVSISNNTPLLIASEGDSYQWYVDGQAIAGAIEQEYEVLQDGNYSVQVGIDFPCNAQSASVFISINSIDQFSTSPLSLFPNPMTQSAFLNLEKRTGNFLLEIFDMKGTLIRKETAGLNHGNFEIKRKTLFPGQYLLRLTNDAESWELIFIVD
ncbi:MAG: T9SS type A sorting domain-containing protein [Bacteroidota bacterium]